jgi:thiosulfate dehydrogenase
MRYRLTLLACFVALACAMALGGVIGAAAPPPSDQPASAPQSQSQSQAQTQTQPASPAAQTGSSASGGGGASAGADKSPLVAATMSLVAAAEVPANPLTDATLDQSPLAKDIRRGFRLFTNTPAEAPQFVPGQVTCSHCHLNAGQRERALPVVGLAGMFPEYNRRAGHLISLTDRIVECFLRSENATGKLATDPATRAQQIAAGTLPTGTSPEVVAIAAYLTWLSRGATVGKNPAWRGQNTIEAKAVIPLDTLDPAKGSALYTERCAACHGPDGQGVLVGDRRPGPLWGPNSWNDGAGAARVYTLAGIIRYTMPYVAPGTLTDEEAQQLAAFINSKPRPAYPFKDRDYQVDPLPNDAVYYRAR